MGWQRDEIATLLVILVILVATIAVGNLAGGGAPHHAAPARVEDDPACAEWTDGCIVCQRTAQGPACSMPGIACTRKDQQCLRRAGA